LAQKKKNFFFLAAAHVFTEEQHTMVKTDTAKGSEKVTAQKKTAGAKKAAPKKKVPKVKQEDDAAPQKPYNPENILRETVMRRILQSGGNPQIGCRTPQVVYEIMVEFVGRLSHLAYEHMKFNNRRTIMDVDVEYAFEEITKKSKEINIGLSHVGASAQKKKAAAAATAAAAAAAADKE